MEEYKTQIVCVLHELDPVKIEIIDSVFKLSYIGTEIPIDHVTF